LTDKKEVVLFELSQQRNRCTALGKITLGDDQKPHSIDLWNSSLLSVLNENSLTVIDMPAVPENFMVESNNRANYLMPVCVGSG